MKEEAVSETSKPRIRIEVYERVDETRHLKNCSLTQLIIEY